MESLLPAARFALAFPLGTSLLLVNEPGLLTLSPPSILLIPNAQRSRCVVEPYEELGDGRGWDPVMKIDSARGVWFPPRPREGGTPTSRVGGGVADADCAASSASMTDSTSSMQISTFSGLRSCAQIYQHPIVGKHGHGRHLYE